jgi:hypothetical protein
MRLRLRYLLMLLLGACQTTPPIKVPEPSPEEVIEKLLATDAAKYPETRHWDNDYDAIIDATLKVYPVKKFPCDPLVTMAGIVLAESGFKRSTKYMEPKLKYYSRGLLQLSVEDESWAKCGIGTVEAINHPIRNLYCGIKLMNRYETKWPTRNFFEAQGAYWSTVRWDKYPMWKGKTQGGVKTVLKYWRDNGCQIQ